MAAIRHVGGDSAISELTRSVRDVGNWWPREGRPAVKTVLKRGYPLARGGDQLLRGRRRVLAAIGAMAFIVAAGALRHRLSHPARTPPTIAVRPFENLSSDTSWNGLPMA